MAGAPLSRIGITTSAILLLFVISCSNPCFASSLPDVQQLGQPVHYIYSHVSSVNTGQLVLADGTSWRSSQPGFGLPATPVLVLSTKQLRTGSAELWLHGFKMSAQYQQGELKSLQGRKIEVLATEQNGIRLMLSDNKVLLIAERDRRYSRHWQGPFEAILTADGQLLQLPTLQIVTVLAIAD